MLAKLKQPLLAHNLASVIAVAVYCFIALRIPANIIVILRAKVAPYLSPGDKIIDP